MEDKTLKSTAVDSAIPSNDRSRTGPMSRLLSSGGFALRRLNWKSLAGDVDQRQHMLIGLMLELGLEGSISDFNTDIFNGLWPEDSRGFLWYNGQLVVDPGVDPSVTEKISAMCAEAITHDGIHNIRHSAHQGNDFSYDTVLYSSPIPHSTSAVVVGAMYTDSADRNHLVRQRLLWLTQRLRTDEHLLATLLEKLSSSADLPQVLTFPALGEVIWRNQNARARWSDLAHFVRALMNRGSMRDDLSTSQAPVGENESPLTLVTFLRVPAQDNANGSTTSTDYVNNMQSMENMRVNRVINNSTSSYLAKNHASVDAPMARKTLQAALVEKSAAKETTE